MTRLSCLLALMASAAAAALAEEPRNENGYRIGPTQGCYERIWTEAELAASPGQAMAALRARVFRAEDGVIFMRVVVLSADQGEVRRRGMGGQVFYDDLDCGPGYKPDFPFCYAYCNGGRLTFPRDDAQGLVFATNQVQLTSGGQCRDGLFDMIGWRDKKLSYRLDRVPMARCEGM